MRPVSADACLALVAACGAALPAQAEPEAPARANDWADLRAALATCWTAPAGTDGSLSAYRFGLDKTGAIRGEPRIIARRLTGDAAARRHYQEAADAALAKCLPMRATPSFGAILGESPVSLRFVGALRIPTGIAAEPLGRGVVAQGAVVEIPVWRFGQADTWRSGPR